MIRIASVECLHDFVARLSFTDGTVRELDLEQFMWGEVFEPLRNLDAFRQVTVDEELGTIVWPNEADLDPDTLYEIALRQAG
jgi:hypothetical protein